MTTIAFDGYTLAADSYVTVMSSYVVGHYNKIWRWKHGWFSLAGKLAHYPLVQRRLNTGKGKITGKFQALVWDERTGVMYEMDRHFSWCPTTCPSAYGSGEETATAAMLAGKSAKKAVQLASFVDLHTGGPVTKVTLRKKKDGKYSPDYSRLAF